MLLCYDLGLVKLVLREIAKHKLRLMMETV
jgi:hypothetical protein